MKLHLPKTLLAAVLALAPCAASATTYGWDNDNGVPTATVDGGTAAIAYPTTATDAAGNVTATGTDPLFYTQTGAITSLTADGYDVKLQLNGSALSGSLTANSLWLTGDKVFTAGTGTDQAQIDTDALYLVGSQMKLSTTSSDALAGTKEIFIGWMAGGSSSATSEAGAARRAAIYATEDCTITQNITVVNSGVQNAGDGAKITVYGGKTLTLNGGINATGKSLVLTSFTSGATINFSNEVENSIGTLYLSGEPTGFTGAGFGVKLVLSAGTTTIGNLVTEKVHDDYENSIRIENGAKLVLTGTVTPKVKTQGASLLMVETGGELSFSETFDGELTRYLSLSGAGTVSNAGSLSISGSMSLSKAIANTGTITFKNGAAIELGGLTATQVTLDESLTGLQKLTTTYSLVTNTGTGQVIKADDASITLKLSGEPQDNFTWSNDNSAVSRIDSIVYNIAVGGSAGYNTVKTEFGNNTGYINVLGTLTGLNEAPAYAVKGTGTVEITGTLKQPANLSEFAGALQIASGGELKLENTPEKIADVDHIEVLTGGTLQAWSAQVNKKVVLDGGKLLGSPGSEWKGVIDIKSNSEICASPTYDTGVTTISGDITGDGAITKTGKGSLKTTGSLSLAKVLTVSEGTMEVAGTTTFKSGYSKIGTGTLKISGNATVESGATLELNDTTQATGTARFSGGGAMVSKDSAATVTLTGTYTGSLTAGTGAELTASWDTAPTEAKQLSKVYAEGANVVLKNVGDSGVLTIDEVVIAGGQSVGAYTGDTSTTTATLSISDLTIGGAGVSLSANLNFNGTALTLDGVADLGGGVITCHNSTLSGSIMDWGEDDSITLFSGVGSFNGYTGDTELSADGIFSMATATLDDSTPYTYKVIYDATQKELILSRSTTAPEPGTATLSLLALAGLCSRRRRKK